MIIRPMVQNLSEDLGFQKYTGSLDDEDIIWYCLVFAYEQGNGSIL